MRCHLGACGTPKFRMQSNARSTAAAVMFIIASFESVALADDFKTINGKEYKDATVKRVEPDASAWHAPTIAQLRWSHSRQDSDPGTSFCSSSAMAKSFAQRIY